MGAARAELESLLRARKLDVTVTTTAPWALQKDAGRMASSGWQTLDERLGGGLRRGQLSEIVGARSSGRSAVFCRIAAAAMARGEVVALVDTHDRFDPAAAEAAGVDLGRLLWVRESGNPDRALKAMNLVLQAGGFGVVAFDVADVRGVTLRQFPHPTWMRLSRIIEGSLTIAVLIASEHLARSPGGVTLALERPSAGVAGEWHGASIRARRLRGLAIRPRIVSARAPGWGDRIPNP
jgi:recA bacterial DNA recombination protein